MSASVARLCWFAVAERPTIGTCRSHPGTNHVCAPCTASLVTVHADVPAEDLLHDAAVTFSSAPFARWRGKPIHYRILLQHSPCRIGTRRAATGAGNAHHFNLRGSTGPRRCRACDRDRPRPRHTITQNHRLGQHSIHRRHQNNHTTLISLLLATKHH